MLFGLKIRKPIIFAVLVVTITYACKDKTTTTYRSFINPEMGSSIAIGKPLDVKILFGNDKKVDSVVYLLDHVHYLAKNDTTATSVKTDGLKLGNHLLTAKIYARGNSDDLTSNFILLSNIVPQEYGYEIIKTLPHDTSSYTEGLEYHDGYFYESAGETGHSSLRRVDVNTGKVVQIAKLDSIYFGEGITLIGNKILQLTYRSKVAFVYDKATFKKLQTIPYTVGKEGWGLYFDGAKILATEGSNNIFFLDKNTYQKTGGIEVYDNNGPIDNLNELEIVNGKIYVNVYTKNYFLIVDEKTGAVEGKVDLSGLLPDGYFKTDYAIGNNVLNGIAYDKAGKRLFVTGKKWPYVFQIKLVKK
ncbi:glutamine cyclotransferase [Pedobacter sp. UYP30]|uniref:glutaminyl-peptide cyclotransferase n=1 Tax=Pedobacter sp. UYP30 TaxID=1756400 RepID=UPI0033947EDF